MLTADVIIPYQSLSQSLPKRMNTLSSMLGLADAKVTPPSRVNERINPRLSRICRIRVGSERKWLGRETRVRQKSSALFLRAHIEGRTDLFQQAGKVNLDLFGNPTYPPVFWRSRNIVDNRKQVIATRTMVRISGDARLQSPISMRASA